MKCPNCGKNISTQAHSCKHCGKKIIRKSDKMAQKIIVNSKVALACGGLLFLIGGLLLFYGAYQMGAIALAVGVAFMAIGRLLG